MLIKMDTPIILCGNNMPLYCKSIHNIQLIICRKAVSLKQFKKRKRVIIKPLLLGLHGEIISYRKEDFH